MTEPEPPRRYAARCVYLKMTLARGGYVLNLCQHIVREGSECVGPFLDETETTCGLWEQAADRFYIEDAGTPTVR